MSGAYTPTIGLEIHAELRTKTKMFCNSLNDPDEKEPNVNICPVCMGHPGTLPTINREAVKHMLKIGLAIEGECADYTEFDRKNYFYPDLPKGYQISQYEYPLVEGGELAGVSIERVHLEEDTARSVHEGEHSLVDFNRGGVPLMELVTKPVIKSAKEASHFARELQLLLRTLGVAEANMEKGEMRVEANVSVSDTDELGTKVEVKNLNSFKSAERAIVYEIKRQTEALEKGERVVQETRGFDEKTGRTFSQRMKEESHDYRYFPDPDLPKLYISEIPEFSAERLRAEMPELPVDRRARYQKEFGLREKDSALIVQNPDLVLFFEGMVAELGAQKEATGLSVNYLLSDVMGLLNKKNISFGEIRMTPKHLARIAEMAHEGAISSRGAKELVAHIIEHGGEPDELAKEKGLLQESDTTALEGVVSEIIDAHPDIISDIKAGKESALQFLVGQAMKATKGTANPGILQQLFRDRI